MLLRVGVGLQAVPWGSRGGGGGRWGLLRIGVLGAEVIISLKDFTKESS